MPDRARADGGQREHSARAHGVAQRAQQGQELHVAVVDRLDVEVDAVEALVHEAADLGHDPLALGEVGEVHGPRAVPLVARPASPPTQGSTRRSGATRRADGEEGAHLLAVVGRQLPPGVEGDQVRVRVARSPAAAASRTGPPSPRLGVGLLEPAVLEPDRVAVVVEGVGVGVARRDVGEVDEPAPPTRAARGRRARHATPSRLTPSSAGGRPPPRRGVARGSGSRGPRPAPSALSRSRAAPERRRRGGPYAPPRHLDLAEARRRRRGDGAAARLAASRAARRRSGVAPGPGVGLLLRR